MSGEPRRAVSGIVLLDKPAGITSNDAVQAVKRAYRAAKAGHCGSLDPLATGLLPICLGEATKLCAYLLDSDKRYSVRARVGVRTATGDAEGEPVESTDASALRRDGLAAVLPQFTGEILQRAPMYSARKHEGQRLYQLARAGIEVPREPGKVRIHELRLVDFGSGTFDLDVRCSKGTYIRVLVEDLARAAGQAAHVEALRRVEVAPFGDGPLVTLDELRRFDDAALSRILLPPLRALAGWPTVQVDAAKAVRLSQGQSIGAVAGPPPGDVAVVDEAGALLGVAELKAGGALAPRRWLAVQAAKSQIPEG